MSEIPNPLCDDGILRETWSDAARAAAAYARQGRGTGIRHRQRMARAEFIRKGVTSKRVKNDELSSARVHLNGTHIGDVWKAWFRLGGSSWTHSKSPGSGFSTRKEAITNLAQTHLRTRKSSRL